MKKNSLNKAYWEERYENDLTGWDLGAVSPPIKAYIDQLTNKSLKILVPGAGNSYEIEYLWNSGFKNIYAVDIAKTPLQNLRNRLPDFPKNRLMHLDFFELEDTFDLIIEQTFFCALHPELRRKYVSKVHQLLKPQGKLSGLLFNFPLTDSGPPFGGSASLYLNLFNSQFKKRLLKPSINSIKEREGKELFFIFEKK